MRLSLKDVLKVKSADDARTLAIDWQHWQSGQALSYGELSEWERIFTQLASKYPELKEEFIENGIIGAEEEGL